MVSEECLTRVERFGDGDRCLVRGSGAVREKLKLAAFFVAFGLIPGLAYQFVQDDLRDGLASSGQNAELVRYVLGIMPNFLGGLSANATIFVILSDRSSPWASERARSISSLVTLFGLWAWEGCQLVLPNGTFDWHDIAWTAPGVALTWLAITAAFQRGSAVPASD